jgi:hypothetical protein
LLKPMRTDLPILSGRGSTCWVGAKRTDQPFALASDADDPAIGAAQQTRPFHGGAT